MPHGRLQPPFGLTRRGFLGALTAAVAVTSYRTARVAAQPTPAEPFTLPPLGYDYDALEPHIDTRTMRVHHTGHHGAFVNNLNRLAAQHPILIELPPQQLLADQCAAVPEAIRTAVRNNLGGHLNHTNYWQILSPAERLAEPAGALRQHIDRDLGGWDKAKADLTAAAMGRFGSGWAWLIWKDGQLSINSTPNQDSPWMTGHTPLLGIDVWEHAYYLKHQNRRADYLADFWQVCNWRVVGELYEQVAG